MIDQYAAIYSPDIDAATGHNRGGIGQLGIFRLPDLLPVRQTQSAQLPAASNPGDDVNMPSGQRR
jgi:hypothetical protein